MTDAHTPGPWLVQAERSGTFTVWTRQPYTGSLATVIDEDINGPYPAKANARLIAAAPDMLPCPTCRGAHPELCSDVFHIAHPAPLKTSADTGELRERVAALIVEKGRLDLTAGFPPFGFIDNPRELADAILDLIQSERGSSPIGQNDQPGLAFSDAGEP